MRRAYALLPHIKITDLLIEVDRWTGFSKHFTHLKTDKPAKDQILLLTAILADGVNLGIFLLPLPGYLLQWRVKVDDCSACSLCSASIQSC